MKLALDVSIIINSNWTSKETYYSVKRDLLQCQKRPTTVSLLLSIVIGRLYYYQ